MSIADQRLSWRAISFAASAPQRPVSPVPGCVPEPHRNRSDRRRVPRPAEQRPRDEELIERELAVEDVTAGQSVGSLEIERRDDLLRARMERFEILARSGAMVRVAASPESFALGIPAVRCRGSAMTARTARTRTPHAGPTAPASDRRATGSSSRSTASSENCAVLGGVERALDRVDVGGETDAS